ncbi:acyl-CoA-like ligand-binding transcription factor [Prauserella cavernicola]|uniref:TetR family transcriptional regulator n=1 Tax=Prauserella cavernicola TaxID=2800127 RepID=A0A934V1E5_9PSEU|nr:TetR family transcriptional regulator [Prauserella cavernicola]MBK1782696.1 TetR family transcriptional regulator [Prauserella cavernicola]
MEPSPSRVNVGGRPAQTSAHQLAEIAQELFLAHGFERTSVADITAAAGVSRRTFFRYFASKADVLWVETPAEQERLRALLAEAPPGESCAEVLYRVVPEALRHPADQRRWALHRAELVLTVPAVQAQAVRRYADWRAVVATFAAERLGVPIGDLVPVAVGHAVLAATVASHEYWVAHPDEDLEPILERLLRLLLPRPLKPQ